MYIAYWCKNTAFTNHQRNIRLFRRLVELMKEQKDCIKKLRGLLAPFHKMRAVRGGGVGKLSDPSVQEKKLRFSES